MIWEKWANEIMAGVLICLIFLAIITMFYLGYLYGVESEKEKWYKRLIKDVHKQQTLKWTAVININYTNKYDQYPVISVAVGSTKSVGRSLGNSKHKRQK